MKLKLFPIIMLTGSLIAPSVYAEKEAKVFTNSIGMKFVKIKGGCFQMGDTFGEGADNEKPVHKVCVDDFYLGAYEVSQKEYQEIMGENPSYFKGENYPVEKVSWDDAQEFIRKLNARSNGVKYSLPTEAQWEYAAREGGKRVRFGNGKDVIDPAEANFDCREENKESYSRAGEYRKTTVPVDSFSPNALGLYNMSGNVCEWCQDRYHDNYQGAPTDGSTWETGGKGSVRVFRGGGWINLPGRVRAADRYWFRADLNNFFLGFRLSLVQHQ
ncbi:MAG: Sulphatase-modifying factor protein [Deltaproteobacteria bacterium]|nr:MAG: Sulphatase-modifying factor protein [Deltaproteobacteria bacterium]